MWPNHKIGGDIQLLGIRDRSISKYFISNIIIYVLLVKPK